MHFDPTFRDDLCSTEQWRQAMIALTLPAPGRYGQVCIVQEKAQVLPLYGQQLRFSMPLPWTLAYEGATLWMSDTPQERLMMLQNTIGMAGHVLVAGGGLGLYVQYLRRYRRAARVTVVESHPDVVAMLRTTLAGDRAIEIVHAAFADFIRHTSQANKQRFDGCFIDIHPTLDPHWLPRLNWLRDQCRELVAGPLRIWGYQWLVRELVDGLMREYVPLLRCQRCFDDDLGRGLAHALPTGWHAWSAARLHGWLTVYAVQVVTDRNNKNDATFRMV